MFAFAAALGATGCFASHQVDDMAPPEPPLVEACSPGEIQTRWVSEWEDEYAGAITEHNGAFYIVYGYNHTEGHIDQIDERGIRREIGPVDQEIHGTAYRWLHVGGELWLARSFGPYGSATWTLEAGRVDPVRGYVPAFSLMVPRGVKSVTALDAERLLVVLDTTPEPARTMTIDIDGRVLRSPMLFETGLRPSVFPNPNGPLYLVLGPWNGEEPREMTVRHLDEAPQTIATEPCSEGYGSCAWDFLALDDGAFLVTRHTSSTSYLERHSPGETPLRVSRSEIGRLRRAPNGSLLEFGTPTLTLLDAQTLAPIGEGEFISEAATSDGPIPTLANIHLSEVSADGRFLALVRSDDARDEPVTRFSLGHICPRP